MVKHTVFIRLGMCTTNTNISPKGDNGEMVKHDYVRHDYVQLRHTTLQFFCFNGQEWLTYIVYQWQVTYII